MAEATLLPLPINPMGYAAVFVERIATPSLSTFFQRRPATALLRTDIRANDPLLDDRGRPQQHPPSSAPAGSDFFNDEHARPPRRSSRSHKNAVEPGISPPRLFFETSLKKMKMSSTAQKRKVGKVMHEHKDGNLKSGSGRMVKSRKQAVVIEMSESGQSKRRKKAT